MLFPMLFAIFALFFVGCSPNKPTVPQSESEKIVSSSPSPIELSATPVARLSPTSTPSPAVALPSTLSIIERPSPWRSDDPRDTQTIDTIVLHSLYNPRVSDRFSIGAVVSILDAEQVSSHYVIDREGILYRLVPDDYQAWHAGNSQMPDPDGRSGVNAFSIGIELIGDESSGFTVAQYNTLAKLTTDLTSRLPIRSLVTHQAIAPARKTDPWGFSWKRLENELGEKIVRSLTIFR